MFEVVLLIGLLVVLFELRRIRKDLRAMKRATIQGLIKENAFLERQRETYSEILERYLAAKTESR